MTSQIKLLVLGPASLCVGLFLTILWWPAPSRFGEWPKVEAVVSGTKGTPRGGACRSLVRHYEYRRDGAIIAARGPHIQSIKRRGECDDRLPASTRVIVAIDPGDPQQVRSLLDEADLRSFERDTVTFAGVFFVVGVSLTAVGLVRLRRGAR